MTAPATFELTDVVAGPEDDPILKGISLSVPCEGILAIAGPSGAGKSTLLRLLNRLDDPLSGTITLDGRSVTEWEPGDLRRRVAMIFQTAPIFPGTVFDNLCVARPDLTRDRAEQAVDHVGMPGELLDRSADKLSGGEAQRMTIARALLTEPAVLLADEPTASLDTASRQTIEDLARELADGGVPLVWITHDTAQLRRIADQAVVLVDGTVVASGDLRELDRHDDSRVRELVGTPASDENAS
ncbi:ABC transporter ATP-binding protein [Ilumatobacter nonamiensis]|uniref:ABC transporter ATP-binding protein n=1 Tax=Ilumatobacter nonamiensis TaxID=467093 RepID=UPI000344963B|nr:ATP-binding cassette domain-containing protein [Ilumatobacter nonamiensis]